MGDNHVVAGAIPAIETICFAPALGWDATLRRSMEKVQFLPVVLRGPSSLRWYAPTICRTDSPPAIFTSPSGTGLVSKTGQQCSIHWWRASPDRLRTVGPPCGVTAAGSSLAI